MKTALFILGGRVKDGRPEKHFLLRTEAAASYHKQHRQHEDISFLVSGRWTNVTEDYEINEAEVGKRFILNSAPESIVYKEDISVELTGNYAFSKPLLRALLPDKVVNSFRKRLA